MNIRPCQRMFRAEETDNIFLSSYTTFYLHSSTMQLYILRNDTERYAILNYRDLYSLKDLISKLIYGIRRCELVECLEKLGAEDASSWINRCIKEGILE